MHVYISVDMEGVAGVASPAQLDPGSYGYPRAQELMTGEANAAVAGAFAGGATEITVSDSHGSMDNLIAEDLDPRARLVFGSPRLHAMVSGIEAGCDLALFVGYHAAAAEPGVLAHSFSGKFTGVRLNGDAVSETELNAFHCATYGVPVALVTGDEAICELVRKRLPGTRTVSVKRPVGWTAADSIHPAAARAAIQLAAAEAVAAVDTIETPSVPRRLMLEVATRTPTMAELCALVPGTARVGVATVCREMADPGELLRVLAVWYNLAAAAG
jgi:D-amino peptidase